MAEVSPVLCPYCSHPLLLDRSTCPSCTNRLSNCYGILSFTDDDESANDTIDRQTIERIAKLTENGSIRTATNEALSERSDATQLLRTIYDTRNDAWRMLVADRLGGRCLDLYTGWGRRSLALAEHVESVYAADPDLAKMRVLDARDDFDSASKIVPIHADDETLPFGENTFDTVVADFTGRSERVTRKRIEALDSMITEDGSILFLLDGIPRKLGVSGKLGLDNSSVTASVDSLRSTRNRCQQALETLGYEEIRIFVLWPSVERLAYIYDVRNARGNQFVVESAIAAGGTYSAFAKLIRTANRLGLLRYCLPNVLVVGSRHSRESPEPLARSVVASGRSRSTQFEYDDTLSCVRKIPTRMRHSRYNEREHDIVQKLRRTEPRIREYLPQGELTESPFGSVRMERPIEGQQLSELIEKSPESRAEVLSIGLDWLLELQRPHQRRRVSFSPAGYLARSEFDSEVVDLSRLPASIQLFETPVHGDFLPENVFVENGEIKAVIDWEYGCMRGNPIVDAGFFITRVIADGRMSGPEGMIELFDGESRFAEIGRRAFEKYCDECGVDPLLTLPLLPLVYLHRVGIDHEIDATNTYTNKNRERLSRAETVWSSFGL